MLSFSSFKRSQVMAVAMRMTKAYSSKSYAKHALPALVMNNFNKNDHSTYIGMKSLAIFTSALLVSLFSITENEENTNPNTKNTDTIYTLEEISKHKTKSTGVWVYYKENVYDITKFIPNHPGGQDKIMLAAGNDLAPFWNLYQQHYNSELPLEILKTLKIGKLSSKDIEYLNEISSKTDTNDPYKDDPILSPIMNYLSKKPLNIEPPKTLLTDSYLTPINLWFVRNHHPVVNIQNIDNYNIYINYHENTKIKDRKEININFNDLKKNYQCVDVIATLQCGGNRRLEMTSLEKTNGASWSNAISTAKWTGVRLRDVLLGTGYTESELLEDSNIQHVIFHGADNMQASIPLKKALSRDGDVLLAYAMNDQPIPPQHGAPLRAIVPGHVGVRNVKWVERITLSTEEAEGPWQRGMSYKGFGPSVRTLEGIDVESIPSLQEQPVQSAITLPNPNKGEERVNISIDEPLIVKGYAYSGGGRGIIRVDVSIDNGKTWKTANLRDGTCLSTTDTTIQYKQPIDQSWGWVFWECDFPITTDDVGKNITIISKATDASYNVQPDSIYGIWNLRGINNNAWSCVQAVVVDNNQDEEEIDN